MNPHLFIYGTLLRSAVGEPGQKKRRHLHRTAQPLGAATIRGQLYDLGSYPGLLLSNQAADIVHGEVVSLVRVAASMKWLDAYEGLTPQSPADCEYRRVEAKVTLGTGRELVAWVYVYQHSCAQKRRVTSGRWSAGSE